MTLTLHDGCVQLKTRSEFQQCKRLQDQDDIDNFPNNVDKPLLRLSGEKKKSVEYIDYTHKWTDESRVGVNLCLPMDIDEKFTVPMNYSLDTKLRWLEGYLDGDGSVIQCDGLENIQISSTNKPFVVTDVYRCIEYRHCKYGHH